MNYEYKMTTNGRAALAACMALEQPPRITRVAFGSGKITEDAELADVHELLEYVSDGAVSQRSHEGDRFLLTIQYANVAHKDVTKVFFLSEFIVYIQDPETGKDTDLIYGTLGDYRQPVPPYHPAYPPSVFNLPLTVVISSELEVQVSATAGLVTYEELADITQKLAIRYIGLTIPAAGWVKDGSGLYPYRRDVPMEGATSVMIPIFAVMEQGEETAWDCGLAPRPETVEGAVRFWAVEPPSANIQIGLTLLRDSTGVVLATPGTGGSLDLPVATANTPGMVMPGAGMVMDKDGRMSVDMATDKEFQQVLDGLDSGEVV